MDPRPVPADKVKAQLAQLEALVADGVLAPAAAARARRRLHEQQPGAGATAPRRLALGIGGLVLAFGALSYAVLGNRAGLAVGPGDSGAETAHAAQAAQIDSMLARLEARLKTQPDDAGGWAMLARSYSVQGRVAEALPAWKRVLELRPQDAQSLADYADALAVANNRSLQGEPEDLIRQALQIDPDNVKALALAGTAAFNRNDAAKAVLLWERALKSSQPDTEFTRGLQGALGEARQRAGLPPVAPGALAALAVAPAPATPGVTGAAASVAGRVSLAAAARARVAPDDTVFIFARAAQGSRMPLAILRKKVSELPLDFELDDRLAMTPAAKLSSAAQVVVGARVSRTGSATPQSGDWQALSAPVALGTRRVQIEIGEAVP